MFPLSNLGVSTTTPRSLERFTHPLRVFVTKKSTGHKKKDFITYNIT